jgi:23S rRNA pseudouridine2605 synthase
MSTTPKTPRASKPVHAAQASNQGLHPDAIAQGERFEALQEVPIAQAPSETASHAWAPEASQAIRFMDVVSGDYDELDDLDDTEGLVQSHEEAEGVEGSEGLEGSDLAKRVLAAQVESPKLHKVLAQEGLGSRLEMERMIESGLITVNDEVAHVGQRIQYGDQIKVKGRVVKVRILPQTARVIAYHKPAGEVVTHDDPQNRPTVFRKLPRLQTGKWQSVGRLDLNTEGLLLLTNSGQLANQLMHPSFGLEREYAVRVLGALSKDEKLKLTTGVDLEDGPAHFGTLEDGGGEGANCWYKVTISEGRNREVRRMFEAVGHAVSRLIRIRYGVMVLPRGLKRGAFVELDDVQLRQLMNAAGVQEGSSAERVRSGLAKPARAVNRAKPGRKGAGPRAAYPKAPSLERPARSMAPRMIKKPQPQASLEASKPQALSAKDYVGADAVSRLRESSGKGARAGQRAAPGRVPSGVKKPRR